MKELWTTKTYWIRMYKSSHCALKYKYTCDYSSMSLYGTTLSIKSVKGDCVLCMSLKALMHFKALILRHHIILI